MNDQQKLGLLVPLGILREWDKNPRNINKDDYKRLQHQIELLGMYKPLLAMPDGETYIILGGNMRLKVLKEERPESVWVSVIQFKKEGDELWHAYVNGVEQMKRFKSKEDGMMEYALSDNDRSGYYDDDMLLNMMPQLDVDWEKYAVDLRPPESLQGIIDQFGNAKKDEKFEIIIRCVSEDDLNEKMGKLATIGISANTRKKKNEEEVTPRVHA